MILVFGATGSVGRALVGELGRAGTAFRAFVRDEAKGGDLGCGYVVGDLDDPDSVRRALVGVEKVFLNSGADEAMVRQQVGVIEAAREAGVKYLVRVSVPNADPAAPMRLGRWHGEIEAALARSEIPAANLRPGYFVQNLVGNASIAREGKIYGAYQQGRVAFIDAADIASAAAALLATERTGVFPLTGPEALTFAQVAERLSVALGQPVTYVDLPPDQAIAGMKARGLPDFLAEELGQLMVVLSRGVAAQVSPAVTELTGRPGRTVDQFFAEHVALFR